MDFDQIDFFGGSKADIGRLSGSDISDNQLDKCPEVSRCAVRDFQNNGCVAVVFDSHPFAEVVCECHDGFFKGV
jgi:hypothetical protein